MDWASIKVTRQHLGLDLPKQPADELLIQPEATGMAIAAGFKEQAAAQFREGVGGAGVGQRSTGFKIPHHRIAVDGVGKAFPIRQVALRIGDQLRPELVVGEIRHQPSDRGLVGRAAGAEAVCMSLAASQGRPDELRERLNHSSEDSQATTECSKAVN